MTKGLCLLIIVGLSLIVWAAIWEGVSTVSGLIPEGGSGYVCSLSIAKQHPELCGGPPPEWVKEKLP